MSWLRSIARASFCRYETGWRFSLLVTAAFAVVQLFGHLHHEFWRDELHCWAVGRNTTGLWDVLTGERRYDGHPFLWYYLLHLVSLLTRDYRALHVVGVGLAITVALLWLRFAPLPRILRVLLLASYYLVYEYGVMSRSYTLGIVLMFAFCALYHPCRIRYVPLGLLLAAMTATSLYGTLIALALGFFLFSHGLTVYRPDSIDRRLRFAVSSEWAAGLMVFSAGVTLTVVTTWPPADTAFPPPGMHQVTGEVIRGALSMYWTAMFPFHDFESWFWPGAQYLFSGFSAGVAAAPWLGAVWLVTWLVALRRSPRTAVTYALGAFAMATAQHTIYPAGWRHLGHYFLLLVACIWLYARETRGRAPARLLHGLFAANLAVQVVTAAVALRTDYKEAFSRAEEAAAFIRDHRLEKRAVVADPDDPASPVAAVLDRPFFFPTTGETTDATVFHNRRGGSTQSQILDHVRRLAQASDGSALLVLTYEITIPAPPGLTVTRLYSGGPSLLGESFQIYDVKIQ